MGEQTVGDAIRGAGERARLAVEALGIANVPVSEAAVNMTEYFQRMLHMPNIGLKTARTVRGCITGDFRAQRRVLIEVADGTLRALAAMAETDGEARGTILDRIVVAEVRRRRRAISRVDAASRAVATKARWAALDKLRAQAVRDNAPGELVGSLDISVRAANRLAGSGVNTITELCALCESEVLFMCGKKSLREIKQVLAARGLSLRAP